MAHYVYRCYDADGRLLYVGQSKDAFARMKQHRSTSFWAAETVQVRVAVHPTPEIARAAERRAIREENPRFNYQGRWETRARWTEQDYRDYALTLLNTPNPQAIAMQNLFAQYSAKFGSAFPGGDEIVARLVARDEQREAKWARDREEWRLQREHLDLADRMDMFAHFAKCETCAKANDGDYAHQCPKTLASEAFHAEATA